MALKTFRPTTPGLRQLVQVDRSHLWKGAPVKVLTEGKTKSGGRNNYGRITTRHIGGGHKQVYRNIDFKRGKLDMPANVERLEYDPNRTAFIALLKYNDGTLSYILAPQRLGVGDTVVSGIKADVKPGNAMQLASMPVGTIVHNIELKAGGGGKIARSAGAYGQLVGRDAGWAIVRLNSGETRRVRAECMATVGAVSNPDHLNEFDRQGRPHALARHAANRALDRHEPDRSSQRRPHQGRQALGHALGQANQGLQDAQEQGDRPVHRSAAPRRQVGAEQVTRSVWKGPFVDGYLLKKAETVRASGRNEIIRIWSRRSTILPQFVGLTFGVYNGHKHVPVNVTEDMIGHKFGEFSPTRTFYGHSGDKKAVRAKPASA